MPNMPGPPDLSYLSKYPDRQGLVLPGVSVSGEGVAPNLLKGTAIPQTYSNMAIDRPSLGSYMGLSPQQYLDPGSVAYSPNYKEMYKDATSKDQFDRFKTDITANPTAMGRFFDKIGVGKLVPTQNYKVKQTILPEGQSIFDEEYLDKARTAAIRGTYANAPGGGLIEGDEMPADLWANLSRGERRDMLKEAGIDPTRKNLKGLGKKFLENQYQQRLNDDRELYEASRTSYENKQAKEQAAIDATNSLDYQISSGAKPRNAWDLMGTGTQPVKPAAVPAVTPKPTAPVTPTVSNNTQTNTAAGATPFYNTNYNWNDVQKENADLIKNIGNFEIRKGRADGQGLPEYLPLTTNPEQFYNWQDTRTGIYYDYSGHDQNKARFKGFDVNALPKDLRGAVLDQSINQAQDPRLTILISQGLVNDADRFNYNNDQITKLFNDPKNQEALSKAYNENPDQFIDTYLDQREVTYGRTNKKGFDQAAYDKLSPVEKDKYLSVLPVSDTYDLSWAKRVKEYRKQDGGTMLPIFQTDGEFQNWINNYQPSYINPSLSDAWLDLDMSKYPEKYKKPDEITVESKDFYKLTPPANTNPLLPIREVNSKLSISKPGIDWNITDPFSKKKGPLFGDDQNKVTLGLPELFPDADKMQTFFNTGEAPLTVDAFSKQLDQYVPKYTGAEPQTEATAEYDAKLRSRISAPAYLNVANATGKYLADNIFGRDERRNAERDFRKSRFLENNLALTSADTQFSPRLRGFDRTTDAYAGAPFAGANVQYGQPLIAQAQKGAELMQAMQVGGIYTLTPEMIKQIIENGGEVEYMDNSTNFENPFNQ